MFEGLEYLQNYVDATASGVNTSSPRVSTGTEELKKWRYGLQ
jgi:hypothetical protein